MFSRLREPFGKAGLIVAIVALVAATVGGAYAANNKRNNKKGNAAAAQAKRYSKAFSKRYSKAFSKRFAVAGPVGPQGPAGADGQNGSNGSNGSKGDTGDNGKSVIVANESPAGCPGEEGVTYEVQGSGNQNEVCDGAEGTFNPNGFTQTGVYGDTPNEGLGASVIFEGEVALAPVSFTIPLQSVPDFVFVPGTETGYGEDEAEGCDGVIGGVPQADEGTFCVYGWADVPTEFAPSAEISPTAPETPNLESGAEAGTEVSRVGTLLEASCAGSPAAVCYARGLWAVTG